MNNNERPVPEERACASGKYHALHSTAFMAHVEVTTKTKNTLAIGRDTATVLRNSECISDGELNELLVKIP